MAGLHEDDDEPTTKCVSAFDFDFEIFKLRKEDYKDLIYEEIMLYHDADSKAKYDQDKKTYPNGNLAAKYGADRVRSKYKEILEK
jgi:hypothetical protein